MFDYSLTKSMYSLYVGLLLFDLYKAMVSFMTVNTEEISSHGGVFWLHLKQLLASHTVEEDGQTSPNTQ